MTSFTTVELYGGAMTVEVPQDYIDASTLRQIPDHQEVFLSRTTLTSVIFEINEYLPPSPANPDNPAAAIYHYTDTVAASDLPNTTFHSSPTDVSMASASLATCPATLLSGTIQTFEREKCSSEMTECETHVHQLLVRMQDHATDLIVRLNVPLKELQGEARGREEAFAKEMLGKVVATLNVQDFGLFHG